MKFLYISPSTFLLFPTLSLNKTLSKGLQYKLSLKCSKSHLLSSFISLSSKVQNQPHEPRTCALSQSPGLLQLGKIFKAQEKYCLAIYSKPKTITAYQYIKSPKRLLLINILKAQDDHCLTIYSKSKPITIWQTFYLKPKTSTIWQIFTNLQSPRQLLFGEHFIWSPKLMILGDYYYLSHTIWYVYTIFREGENKYLENK